MAYSKNAFNCAKCPQKGGDGGCPAWWELVWDNHETGASRIRKSCAFEQLPEFMVAVARAADQAGASADKLTTQLANSFGQLTLAFMESEEQRKLENGRE